MQEKFVVSETSTEDYEGLPSPFCLLFSFSQQYGISLGMSQLLFLLNLSSEQNSLTS